MIAITTSEEYKKKLCKSTNLREKKKKKRWMGRVEREREKWEARNVECFSFTSKCIPNQIPLNFFKKEIIIIEHFQKL
jgi:hypothetical protein